MRLRAAIVGTVVLLSAVALSASGAIGFYGIIEKVVFEPNEQAPERIQVWGAFAYADGAAQGGAGVSSAKRGYLYFALPASWPSGGGPGAIRSEWADLKSIAGKGQAVGFGRWSYSGAFGSLQPDAPWAYRSGTFEREPYATSLREAGGPVDLRVRDASAALANPSPYQTNMGVVKLTEANHGPIVKALRDALKR